MNFSQWQQENTQHYRGYSVMSSGICDATGDTVWMTFNKLGGIKGEILENAKRVIDVYLGETK